MLLKNVLPELDVPHGSIHRISDFEEQTDCAFVHFRIPLAAGEYLLFKAFCPYKDAQGHFEQKTTGKNINLNGCCEPLKRAGLGRKIIAMFRGTVDISTIEYWKEGRPQAVLNKHLPDVTRLIIAVARGGKKGFVQVADEVGEFCEPKAELV